MADASRKLLKINGLWNEITTSIALWKAGVNKLVCS
jgi:hypothetical protein